MSQHVFKMALVAGEASSDLIGANLIKDLQILEPQCEVIAVGGKQIKATGVKVIQDNEVFSVMGLFEVLKDLPRLLKLKKQIVADIVAFNPDVFIGVDSPDLNFAIAKSLKKHDIPVMHYVSPSVWAWRPKRIYKMQKFIDGLLTLFPFEVPIYQNTTIKAKFVGHPLATQIPVNIDKVAAKQAIGKVDKNILAVLPGSRNREIKQLMPIFCQTIKQLGLNDQWCIMSSNVNPHKVEQVQSIAAEHQLEIQMVDSATLLLKAADFALLGSGTVALEAMLCKTPMVVAYKISALTWWVVNTFKMMQLPYYTLPNVLHGDFLVPEVMQKDLTVEKLTVACQQVMRQPQEGLLARMIELHQSLLPEKNNQAALAVLDFLEQTS
ncbi:MAG: lipid-A-disaccharide synthase [Xanthomonadales bacterium]|nr:lipid-A-disaccharide synthase [Xanthomonadales bacterium]